VGLDRPLSALELTALGIVLKRGPCLAHSVVNEFAGSQTFAYRSGAGSIYPLLRRLTDANLLHLQAKRYTLTDEGREVLRQWLRGPFDAGHFTTSLDELRSRAYFLRLLTREEAIAFAESALLGLHGLLVQCQETVEAYRATGDRFSQLAMQGAVRETEARIAWMTDLLAHFRTDDFWAEAPRLEGSV
jgi:DNA-binding PadR family transcriptional regulator